MATTGLCRFDAYEVVAAQLDGGDYAVDVCNDPATYTAVVERAGDGLSVRIDVDVCPIHEEALAVAAEGWKTSIKKRIT